MQLTRRDDRRRRVLTDDLSTPPVEVAIASSAAAPSAKPRRRADAARYGEPGFVEGHPRISDLVPHTYVGLAFWFALGLTMLGGLESLHFYLPRLLADTSGNRIAAFDLGREANLADWFASAILTMSAACALLIFSVRRHKTDDYHGRYRTWLWAGLLWLVMSMDETAGLHHGFQQLMSRATGTHLVGDGAIWWVLGYGLLWVAVGGRLLFQLRAVPGALVLFLAAAGCYVGAVATQLKWLAIELPVAVMLEEGLELGGNLLILFSTLVFARFAILESKGQTAGKRRTTRSRKTDAARTTEGALQVATQRSGHHPDESTLAQRPKEPAGRVIATSSGNQLRVDPTHGEPRRRLSKAERRALRKQQLSGRERDY